MPEAIRAVAFGRFSGNLGRVFGWKKFQEILNLDESMYFSISTGRER